MNGTWGVKTYTEPPRALPAHHCCCCRRAQAAVCVPESETMKDHVRILVCGDGEQEIKPSMYCVSVLDCCGKAASTDL